MCPNLQKEEKIEIVKINTRQMQAPTKTLNMVLTINKHLN